MWVMMTSFAGCCAEAERQCGPALGCRRKRQYSIIDPTPSPGGRRLKVEADVTRFGDRHGGGGTLQPPHGEQVVSATGLREQVQAAVTVAVATSARLFGDFNTGPGE